MLDEPLEDGQTPADLQLPIQKIMFLILKRIWQFSHIPAKWRTAELISISKKGDLTHRDDYQGISLIEIIVKIITKLLVKQVSEKLESNDWLARNRLALEIVKNAWHRQLMYSKQYARQCLDGVVK